MQQAHRLGERQHAARSNEIGQMPNGRNRIRLVHEHKSPDYRIELGVRSECGQVGLDKTRLREIERGGVGTGGCQDVRRPVNAYNAAARANACGCQARNGACTATDIEDPLARTNSGVAQQPFGSRAKK
jgi:hypothetical protein